MYRRQIAIRRTAKVLAASRFVLAAAVLTEAWLEPDHSRPSSGPALQVLWLYMGWSGALALIIWRSWWWDFRLARAVHGLDIAVFIGVVFLTEAASRDPNHPFLVFAAFLLVTAMARWGQRSCVITGLTLVMAYILGGVLFSKPLQSIDGYQYAQWLINLTVLSLMSYLCGADVRMTRLAPMPAAGGIPDKRRAQIMAGALLFAKTALNARGVAIAVTGTSDPRVDLYRNVDGQFTHEWLSPGALTEDFDTAAVAALFDIAKGHRILAYSDARLEPVHGPFGHGLPDRCGVATGILARVIALGSHGQLLVWGIPDPCIDHLPVIALLAQEVGQALDHEDMAVLAQSIAVTGERNALARDLHDSMAQLLAGTLFRLAALRRTIREGRNPDAEILTMREALRSEQHQLRSMIGRLRGGDRDRTTDIVGELQTLMVEMGEHWQISTSLHSTCQPLTVSIRLAHELRQLVREAVANAVRHGQCSRVDLVLDHATQGLLQVSIGDNGQGFPITIVSPCPRSISERIDALGGQLRIASGTTGVRLDIDLPLPIAA